MENRSLVISTLMQGKEVEDKHKCSEHLESNLAMKEVKSEVMKLTVDNKRLEALLQSFQVCM